MKQTTKAKASAITLSGLLAVLICIVGLRISASTGSDTETADDTISSAHRMTIAAATVKSLPEAETPEHRIRVVRYEAIKMSSSERDELAALVYLEAGNQPAEGQQAVVEVVFNRMLNPAFPNTVHDVIHQGEHSSVQQFSVIDYLDAATPTQAQYDAIDAALYEKTITDDDVVFFSRSGENDRVWGRIGDHVFCRAYVW